MTIAELFVNIGIKGQDNAGRALKSVSDKLGDVRTSSLAAKAAILGVVYGLEQMMTNSMNQGMALQSFATFTGLSADRLQRWQYALRQSGVAADETAGAFKGIQAAMTNMLLGKGAPTGFDTFARAVGLDMNRVRDAEYMMKKLQEFAKLAKPDIGNAVLGGMGLSPNVIQAMRRNVVDVDKLKNNLFFSQKEIGSLANAEVAWANLGDKINKAFGHFTASHGTEIVKDIDKIAMAVIRLVESLTVLGEKYKIFEKIAWVIGQLSGAVDDVTDYNKGKRTFWGDELDPKTGKIKTGVPIMQGGMGNLFDKISKGVSSVTNDIMKPSNQLPVPADQKGNAQTVNQTNNITVHGAEKPQEQVNEIKKATHHAVRQMKAITGEH